MLNVLKTPRREKLGITYFGLQGHEVAVLESMMQRSPDLLGEDYELRDPNHAGSCEFVFVNRDNKVATSWWKNYKKRYPSAVPLFLTDSKAANDDDALCKRPFTPSFVQTAFQGLMNQTAS